MITKQEIISIIVASLVLAVSMSFATEFSGMFLFFTSILFVILFNFLAKKIAASIYDTKITIRIWEVSRFGFRPSQKTKNPLLMGLIAPLITGVISTGTFVWLNSLVFDVKTEVHRVTKKYGFRTKTQGVKYFTEITNFHIGLIAIWGILANILFGILGILIGFPLFAKLNFYYAFFNLIPLSDLDGNKVYFGSIYLWYVLLAVCTILTIYATTI
jgi:Zn-dependent protease